MVLQKKQDLPLPPYILHSSLYHLINVSFPVKHPKSTESIYSCNDLLLKSFRLFRFYCPLLSPLFQLFSVSQAAFVNFFLRPYSIEPFPIKLSFNIACSMQMGSLLPSPSFENWWFQIETREEIPHVRLYCGREMVNQCSLRHRRGSVLAIVNSFSIHFSEGCSSLASSSGISTIFSQFIQILNIQCHLITITKKWFGQFCLQLHGCIKYYFFCICIFIIILILPPMGIHKLMDLLRENSPDSIKSRDIKYYSGMSLALDASMSMYQFLVSTQGISSDSNFLTSLTDSEGNKTGHLLGLFNRTILLIQHGIKPVWVFDGKAPTKKNGELLRRRKLKQQATQKRDEAEEVGNLAQALKQQQRTTYISKKERQDVMHMLRLMGVPVIQAPGQAEAQASFMNKNGKVDAVCTQDTDCLVFGAVTMIRDLNNKKQPLTQITRQKILEDLQITNEQFIDLCILSGCDYSPKIEGIGPVKALKYIKQLGSIEQVIKFCKSENDREGRQRYVIPKQNEFTYEDARQLFKKPHVTDEYELKWQKNIDEEALKKFLCVEKQFSEVRVDAAIKKLKTNKGTQPRLQAFFGKPTVVKSSFPKQQAPKKKTNKKK